MQPDDAVPHREACWMADARCPPGKEFFVGSSISDPQSLPDCIRWLRLRRSGGAVEVFEFEPVLAGQLLARNLLYQTPSDLTWLTRMVTGAFIRGG